MTFSTHPLYEGLVEKSTESLPATHVQASWFNPAVMAKGA
jgi:hypothetical protein